MITVTNIHTYGWMEAIQGMRNPRKSWWKSDSIVDEKGEFILGPEDKKLAMGLVHGGSEHCKFRRMIYVICDICAPMYFWKDMDTYKVGTTANSTSSYDILRRRNLEWSDFSTENLDDDLGATVLIQTIEGVNKIREKMTANGRQLDRFDYAELSALLPAGFNYIRTWSANYEVLANIYKQRRNHRLKEFRDLCKIFEDELPYPELITGREKEDVGPFGEEF